MDLNEKLAARRRELAVETDKAAQVEAARQRVIALEAEKAAQIQAARQRELEVEAERIRQSDKKLFDAEVARRLAETGIAPPATIATPKPGAIHTKAVEAEVEKAITAAATKRMSGFENFIFFSLLLLGIGGFFVKWWLGLVFVIWSVVYMGKRTDKHKQEIIAEGKTKAELAKAQKE